MAELRSIGNLFKTYPNLRRLGRGVIGRRITFIAQMEREDCGAACLAMVLDYYGKEVSLAAIREATGTTSRDGLTAFDIKQAARRYGLRCRPVWLRDVADLRNVDEGAILHYITDAGQKHFVVLERCTKRDVHIVDPASGRRCEPLEQFSTHFAGTVLMFEPAEDFEPAVGGRTGVWPYLSQVLRESGVLRRIILTSFMIQAFALALPLLTKILIDRRGGDYHLLTVLAVGLAAIVFFNFLTSVVRAHLLLHLRTRLDLQLTLGFVEHLMRLPYAFFQKRSTGDLVMRLNSNTTVREMLTSSVLAGLLDGTLVILYFLILFAISFLMGAIVLVLAVIQVGLFACYYPRYKELMTRELGKQARAQGYEVEMLSGIETLKVAGAEHVATQRWSNLFVDVLNVTLARGRLSALAESLLGALRMASPLLILCTGAALVIEDRMTLGTMFAVNAIGAGLLTPLASVVNSALQFSTIKSYIERIKDVLESPTEQQPRAGSDDPALAETGHDPDAADRTRHKPDAPALQGNIALEDVSFRYGPPHQPLVVKSVCAEIARGQHVAIVGRSGSGKSTLARLLVGLYAPTDGRILYDGINLEQFDYVSVRRQMGFVPQDPYLFGETIRQNISLANPDIALEDVQTAARLARIHDEIAAMPSGYDTLLTEGGMSLSGGQRQRIALARALLHKPRILVLDEATSDLDTVNESAIQVNLESLDCTTVVIAHRLSTIINADMIIVMKNGEVEAHGTHEELMALGGEYAALVAAQMGPQPSLAAAGSRHH